MKHWFVGNTANGTGIKLKDRPDDAVDFEDFDGRVVSLTMDEGQVVFREQCDEWFSVGLSKDDAIEALREAIAWIEAGGTVA